MIPNNKIFEFDDIIDIDSQILIGEYFKNQHHKFGYYKKNISLGDDSTGEYVFPGWSINIDNNFKVDNKIMDIIKEIEKKSIEKCGLEYKTNYRYKLNAFPPLPVTPTINELYKNIHRDSKIEHIVLIYYVNDIDGNTLLFKNKIGDDSESNRIVEDEIKNGNTQNITLFKEITPKRGKVIIFSGNLLHCAGWPTNDVRYNINYNIVIKTKKKGLI